MLRECMAVALGGAVGSVGRYAIMAAITLMGAGWLPLATLIANLLGCFAIGWLAQWSLQQDMANHWLVVGTRIGLLGGLTTFSSFAVDVLRLWQSDKLTLSLGLVLAHVLLGLIAVLAGLSWARP